MYFQHPEDQDAIIDAARIDEALQILKTYLKQFGYSLY